MQCKSMVFILILAAGVLSSCGENQLDEDNDKGKTDTRVKIDSLSFKDANLAACVQEQARSNNVTYVEDFKSLHCQVRGTIPNDTRKITYTDGIEQLTALEDIFFSNEGFYSIYLKLFKNLRRLEIYDTPLYSFDVSENKNLEIFTLMDNDTEYKDWRPQWLDLSNNPNIREVTAKNLTYFDIPTTAPLTSLNISFEVALFEDDLSSLDSTTVTTTNIRRSMDFSAFTDLQYLYLKGQFESIQLPINSHLTHFHLNGSATAHIDNLLKQVHLQELSIPLTADIESLPLNQLKNLSSIVLSGDGLKQLDLSGLDQLSALDLSGPAIADVTLSETPSLLILSLNTPKLHTLKLPSVPLLQSFTYGNGDLNGLSIDSAEQLTSMTIGNTQLAELLLPNCEHLAELTIGNNQLNTLDITHCNELETFSLGSSHIRLLDLSSNTQLKTARSVNPVVAPKMTQVSLIQRLAIDELLANGRVADARLAQCIRESAKTANAVYADELLVLKCVGGDGKAHLGSLYDFITPSSTSEFNPQRVFSTLGLGYFPNLEYIDLTGNWLDAFEVTSLPQLKTLILDYNVFQTLNLTSFAKLTTLSLNANPLSSLSAPINLQRFIAYSYNMSQSWGYIEISLGNQFDLPRMKNLNTGLPLTTDDYNTYFGVNNSNQLIMLETLLSDRPQQPSTTCGCSPKRLFE